MDDDLDMALSLSHRGDFDPLNPAHARLLQPHPDFKDQHDAVSEAYFKEMYPLWLASQDFLLMDDTDDFEEKASHTTEDKSTDKETKSLSRPLPFWTETHFLVASEPPSFDALDEKAPWMS